MEILKLAMQKKQWILTKKAAQKIKESYEISKNVILFISVSSTNVF